MKKRTRWILIGVGIVAALIVAAAALNAARGPVAQVKTAEVTEGALEKTVSASGEVRSRADIDVYSPIQSTIKQVLVADEARVSIGQPLVKLDIEPYEIAKAQAWAGVAQAGSSRSSISKTEPTSDDYKAAKAAVTAAYSAYWEARKAFIAAGGKLPGTTPSDGAGDRWADPAAQTSPPTKGQLKVSLDQAYAAYRQALAALSRLDVSGATGPEKAAASAAERQARLAYDKAIRDIENGIVRAPIAGVVFLDSFTGTSLQGPPRKIAKNQGVSPQAPICRIVDASRMKFTADVDEADIAIAKKGQRATVTLDAFTDKDFKGSITALSVISKTTQSGGSAFAVDVMLPVGASGLRVGMSGTADITVAKRPSALQVPIEAVVERDGKDVVFVVEDGKAKLVPVALGLSTDTVYEVKSGLSAGQRVITSGLEGLKDGQRVAETR